MGQSCLLKGEVTGGRPGRLTIATGAGDLDLEASDGFRRGEPVLISIRPEHFRSEAGTDAVPLGTARIESLSFLGTHHQARMRHEADPSFRPTLLLPQVSDAKVGEALKLWIERDKAVVLPMED
jgi:spermidine/putrescine transport system ATP-binding protein